jgi:hypothetical protein
MIKTLIISFFIFLIFVASVLIIWWMRNGKKVMNFFNDPSRRNMTKEQSLQELMKLTSSHTEYKDLLEKIVKQNKEYEDKNPSE